MAQIVPSEDEELNMIAIMHGYKEDDQQLQHEHDQVFHSINHISPVPSQILTLYQKDKLIHLDIDTGSWVSCVKQEFAQKMNWTIYPNAQLAKLADNKTVLKSVGEVHEQLNRNNWVVDFHALVLPNLHADTIAGNNFMKDNKVEQSINNKTITILGKYVVPETNRNIMLPTHINNIIVSEKLNKVILPQQTIRIKVPLPDHTQVNTIAAYGTLA